MPRSQADKSRVNRQDAGFSQTRVSVVSNSENGWETEDLTDFVVEERPVALVYNGVSHAVMMATPQDLEDFALGFSLSEGIIHHPEEMFSCDIIENNDTRDARSIGLDLQLHIHGERMHSLKSRHRAMAGPTGCGLCGKRSLEETLKTVPAVTRQQKPSPQTIQNAIQCITSGQRIQLMTGACHAAAWMSFDAQPVAIREDVGRHNALDKLIGALAIRKIKPESGFLVVTSRASYEMVYKAATVGITTLVAVSGATGLAVETARNTGMNLIGFARQGRQVVY